MFESRSCEYLAAISCKFGKPGQACLNSMEAVTVARALRPLACQREHRALRIERLCDP
jgi:hypothetical protein